MMTVLLPLLFVLLSLLGFGCSQFVTPPKNLTSKTGYAGVGVRYKEVPTGICEQDPNVKSYSGYADVAEDQHIFWWFFEARNVDPTTAPLTIWINGGPGSSSMIGLFQELGPCGVDLDGNVYNNPYSWSNASNLIVIDQPTTTGLSYSIPVPAYTVPADSAPGTNAIIVLPNATCPDYANAATCGTYSIPNVTLTANSTVAAAPNFWRTLQGFSGAFPQYCSNGWYFATESYGGHYAPIFSDYILQQNELLKDATAANDTSGGGHIDLRGVLIGNGWFDPILQYQAYYNYSSSSPGNTYNVPELPYNATWDAKVYNNLYGPYNCLDQLLECNAYPYATNTSDGEGNAQCAATDKYCLDNVETPFDQVTNRDEYDVRYYTPDPFPYAFYVEYLNRPEVQEAIGAYVNFSEGSDTVGSAFAATGDDAREIGVTQAVENLIAANLTVVLYFGDADFNCNWLGGEAFSFQLDNVPAYTDGTAGFVNITTSDDIVHGQVKSAGQFSFVRIYYSGHEVPFYQPLVSLEMLERVLNGFDIATGQTKVTAEYVTNGTARSTFFNGGDTVMNVTVPTSATYNTTTNKPNPFNETDGSGAARLARSLWERNADALVRTGKPSGLSSRYSIAKKRAAHLRDASAQMKKRASEGK